MSVFDDAVAGLTDAVCETFGRTGPDGGLPILWPADGSDPVRVRLTMDRGLVSETLAGAMVVRPQITGRIPVADAASVRAGDELDVGAERFRIAGAPERPGAGVRWVFPLVAVQVPQ